VQLQANSSPPAALEVADLDVGELANIISDQAVHILKVLWEKRSDVRSNT